MNRTLCYYFLAESALSIVSPQLLFVQCQLVCCTRTLFFKQNK